MKIDQEFRNGLSLFVQEQKAIVFKNNRLLFPYCFPIVLWSKNSETGYQNAIFFLNGLWRLLKMGTSPSSYIQVPPVVKDVLKWVVGSLKNLS